MAQESTPPNVADSATTTADIPARGLILLGTFGDEADPQALVRLPDGKTARVATGEMVTGRKIIAIEAGRLAVDRNGSASWIDIPG